MLKKLEIYSFATCADIMSHAPNLTTEQGHPVPWIEHFGNERDWVARCGMLAPNQDRYGIRIDGRRFVKKKAWGHLLNHHYLRRLARSAEPSNSPEFLPFPYSGDPAPPADARPRLLEYFDGKAPPPY